MPCSGCLLRRAAVTGGRAWYLWNTHTHTHTHTRTHAHTDTQVHICTHLRARALPPNCLDPGDTTFKKKKKSETEFTASVLKKRSEIHRRLKERFLIRRNKTKRANFRGSPLSQATYNNKTEEQTLNSIYIVSVGRGRLADGKGHETQEAFFCLFVCK